MESDLIEYTYDITTDGEDTEDATDPKPQPLQYNADDNTLTGYAVVWGAISIQRPDGYRHQFNRGSIKWADQVDALFNHAFTIPLASTRNSTLTIVEDDYGAKVTIKLDDTTDGQNALKRVQSNLVSGMSFGGKRSKTSFKPTTDPTVIQPFGFVAHEVSLVIFPAVKETRIATTKNSASIEKDKQINQQKNKLANVRLSLYRPGI